MKKEQEQDILDLNMEFEDENQGDKQAQGNEIPTLEFINVDEPYYMNEKKSKEKKKESSVFKEFLSWVLTLGCAILAAMLLKNFVIINATVPTGSMENTIKPGDNLIGLRVAYLFSEPERGDIIIFPCPDDESQNYVKRIIGLPGEKVTINNGYIYIDDSNQPLKELYLKEEWFKARGPFEFDVPEDGYFVMGDNRNDSFDSRYWQNTYVKRDKIIGKAEIIYYPFNHFGVLE